MLLHLTDAVYPVDISVRNLQKYQARSCDSPPDCLTPIKSIWKFLFTHVCILLRKAQPVTIIFWIVTVGLRSNIDLIEVLSKVDADVLAGVF